VSTGNLCRQGRGWGYDNGGIWVDRGCRADFSYGRDNGNWSGGGSWNGPGTLTCESISYRYRRCDVDTQNRVNLMRELSTGNLCRQGYGWGYDNRGIWVDRGCRGEFSYGRDSNGRDRHNDAAIAAGIIGALAIGAAIGSSQSQAAAPPPPPPSPPPVAVQGPPAWAIGSYHAYDSDSGDIAQLVVDGGGRVYLRDENGNIVNQGQLWDGLVTWTNGKRSFLAREGPGVMIGDVDTGKHYYFRRNG
jgi:hypothetical protein